MKTEVSDILEDWRPSCCSRCGLQCNPCYRVCFNSVATDLHGNFLFDEEFDLCRFCLPKVVKGWTNIISHEPSPISRIEEPKKKDWQEECQNVDNE